MTAKIINNTNAVLPSGWYVVSKDVNISDFRLTVLGSANIILADGKTFTITGGTVTATGGVVGYGICGRYGASGSIINITGGNIRAMRGETSLLGSQPAGIGDSKGATISLDYTNDVSIYATNYHGTVTLQKDFLDTQNNYYPSGKVTDNGILSGKTLVPVKVVLANDADNSAVLSTNDGRTCVATLSGRTLRKNGDWNTLCLPFSLPSLSGTPLEGATVKTLCSADFINGMLALTFGDDLTGIEAGKPYIVRWDGNYVKIGTEAEWNTFAANVNNGTETYADKIVQLTADIDISLPVGTNSHPFMGIFDGQGHTLNVNISDTQNQGTAPFRYIYGATIKNVKTTGTINGTMHCSGLVGFAKTATDYSTSGILMVNNINNCEVAATITCGGTTHTHCGGILGHGTKTATTIKDCLFSGSISGATTYTGIIYGWGDTGRHTIINCLADGNYEGSNGVDMIKSGDTRTITNCYKTQNIGERGTYTTATGSQLASMLGSGWEVRDGKVVPKIEDGTDIVNPVFYGVTIDNAAPTAVEGTDGNVKFVGHYSPFTIDEGNINEIVILDSDNQLGYSETPREQESCRAYFWVKPNDDGSASARRVMFGPYEVPTMMTTTDFSENTDKADAWYTVDGRRLSGKPTLRGIYVNKGRKIVIK